MIDIRRLIYNFLGLIGIVISLGFAHQFLLVNIIFILICYYSYEKMPFLNIFLFVVFLSSNGMISTNYNLLGFFHVNRIINIFTILTLVRFPRTEDYKLDGFQKFAIILIIYIILSMIFKNVKAYAFGLTRSELSIDSVVKGAIKDMILGAALIFLTQRFHYKGVKETMILGIGVSVIFLSLSIVFSSQLAAMGFSTMDGYDSIDEISQMRKSGFFSLSGGDVNSAAGFFALALGILLMLHEKHNIYINHYLIITFAVIGVLGTISRAGAISVVGVILVYFVSKDLLKPRTIRTILFLAMVVFILYYLGMFNYLIERFQGIEETIDSENDSGRWGGWLFYIKYTLSDVSTFLFGSTENIYNYSTNAQEGYFRVAHNFYITALYNFGIFAPILLIFILFRLYKSFAKLETKKIYFLFIFIPFFVTTMTTSDNGIFLPFILAIPFLPMLAQKNDKASQVGPKK